jgi:hypothetical protein
MITANIYLKFLIMKNLLNLGKALDKAEQKSISGGGSGNCGQECTLGSCSGPSECVEVHYPGGSYGLSEYSCLECVDPSENQ